MCGRDRLRSVQFLWLGCIATCPLIVFKDDEDEKEREREGGGREWKAQAKQEVG